jgi:YD repeat-containing protein
MKAAFLFLLLISAILAKSQYYYTDIIGSREINKQMAGYTSNNVKTVTATGTDKNGVRATDFSEYHEVRENGMTLRIVNITGFAKTVTLYKFDKTGRVISVIDSTSAVQNTSSYEYDASGKLIRVQNKVTDSSGNFNQTETHIWLYNSGGKPEKMLRSFDGQNSKDSMEVKLIMDENGNVSEEKTYKKNKETSFLYYYYDDKNQLTDIIRYNTKAKKLMPDVMFEYDDAGNIIQKITTTSSQHLGYLIWRYIFNDKGLKTKEALFNSQKELTGKIEYGYTFNR